MNKNIVIGIACIAMLGITGTIGYYYTVQLPKIESEKIAYQRERDSIELKQKQDTEDKKIEEAKNQQEEIKKSTVATAAKVQQDDLLAKKENCNKYLDDMKEKRQTNDSSVNVYYSPLKKTCIFEVNVVKHYNATDESEERYEMASRYIGEIFGNMMYVIDNPGQEMMYNKKEFGNNATYESIKTALLK